MPATRKVGCRRNKKQMGGGLGGVLTFAPALNTINNPLAVGTTSSCLAAVRPGTIGSFTPHGLPGMSGGRRKGKKSRRSRKSKKQSGGAYGFSGETGIVAGTQASYPTFTSIGCTGASQTAIPASGAAGSLNRTGGELWDGQPTSALQRGGSYQLGETLRTAAYTQLDGSPNSTFGTAAGTVLSVNIPVDGRVGAPCGQKGGRRSSRKNRKSKNRKASKKSKKSKKNRK
jgi:hypothetical protein